MTVPSHSIAVAAGVLPPLACELLCDRLPRAASLGEAMVAVNEASVLILGKGLLTVNVDAAEPGTPAGEIRLRRIWSSDPAAYPVGGGKTKTRTPWTRHLIEEAQVFVGEGDEVLATVFDDHARIAALGLHAIVNVPIVENGRCVATFNLLGSRSTWASREVLAIRMLALLASPHVLAARQLREPWESSGPASAIQASLDRFERPMRAL